MREGARLSARLLGTATWTLVGVLAIAFLAVYVEPVGVLIDRRAPGSASHIIGTLFWVLSLAAVLTTWLAAMVHVATEQPWPHVPPRWFVMLLLIVGNSAAAVVYYFLALHWQPREASRTQLG